MSNPFDDDADDAPPKSYTSKNTQSAEEMAKQYEREIERLMQESLSSTQRSVGQLDSSEKLGTDAARDLLAQREKLERTERNLDDINHTTQMTQRSLNSLKSVFGGFFKNKFSKAPQKPQQPNEVPQSNSSGRLTQTIERHENAPPTTTSSTSGARTLTETSRQQITGTRWGAMDEEIDENLGMMSNKLANLRNLGVALGSEVEEQNQMLDRIDQKASRNDATVRSQDNQMKKLLGYKPPPPTK